MNDELLNMNYSSILHTKEELSLGLIPRYCEVMELDRGNE